MTLDEILTEFEQFGGCAGEGWYRRLVAPGSREWFVALRQLPLDFDSIDRARAAARKVFGDTSGFRLGTAKAHVDCLAALLASYPMGVEFAPGKLASLSRDGGVSEAFLRDLVHELRQTFGDDHGNANWILSGPLLCGSLRPASTPSITVPVLLVEKRPGTDEAAGEGLVANLSLELVPRSRDHESASTSNSRAADDPESSSSAGAQLYPIPALAFVERDPEFLAAEAAACAYIKSLGLWPSDADIRWRLTLHSGEPLPLRLEGNSAGGAFAIGLATLIAAQAKEPRWAIAGSDTDAGELWRHLRTLEPADVEHVVFSAAINAQGVLSPVGSLSTKLGWELCTRALRGEVRTVVVADGQDEAFLEKHTQPGERPFLVIKAEHFAEAVRQLVDESAPRRAVRDHERKLCATLEILGKKAVPLDPQPSATCRAPLYQVLPLLQEVKRRWVPRGRSRASGDGGGAPPSEREEERGGLQASDIMRWEEEVRGEQVSYERVSLEAMFNDFRGVSKEANSDVPRFVLLGPPGSGKTTLEQYLAWRVANGTLGILGRQLVPARVPLREWEAWTLKPDHPEASLPGYLAQLYGNLRRAPQTEEWRLWLQSGDVLLLLDGLDEIEGKRPFVDALKAAVTTFGDCPTVLTCRTVSFEQHQAVCRGLPVFTLSGLDDFQRDAFIRAYAAGRQDHFDPDALIEQLHRTPLMRPLAANPLLLSLICSLVDEQSRVTLPSTHAELYDKMVEKLLSRPQRVPVTYPGKPDEPPPAAALKRAILAHAALTLFADLESRGRLTFSQSDFLEALTTSTQAAGLAHSAASSANALLTDLVQNSGILRGGGSQGYFFLHSTIHEFLVADALAGLVNRPGGKGWNESLPVPGVRSTVRRFVDKKAWDPAWEEVVCLLAGRVRDPEPLLTLLADPVKDDSAGHRLCLGARCLPEVSSRNDVLRGQAYPSDDPQTQRLATVVQEIGQEVVDLWFALWRKYLSCPHVNRSLPAVGACCPDAVRYAVRRLEGEEWEDDVTVSAAIEILGAMGAAATQHADIDVLGHLRPGLGRDDNVGLAAFAAFEAMGDAAVGDSRVLDGLLGCLNEESWFEVPSNAYLEREGVSLGEAESELSDYPEWRVDRTGLSLLRFALLPVSGYFFHNISDHDLRILCRTADQHPEAVELRKQWMPDPDGQVRFVPAALAMIGRGQARHRKALALMARWMRDEINPKPLSRYLDSPPVLALAAIARVVASYPKLIAQLMDGLLAPAVNLKAAAAVMARMGEAAARQPRVLSRLVHWLHHEHAWLAAEVFAMIGLAAAQEAEVIDQLVLRLDPDDPVTARAAARALRAMGPAATGHSQVIPQLVRCVWAADPDLRREALWSLRAMGETAVGALQQVVRSLAISLCQRNRSGRWEVAWTLGWIGEPAARHPHVVPRLLDCLDDSEWNLRWAALVALGSMGTAATSHPGVVPRLISSLQETDGNARWAGLEAVRRMGASAATYAGVLQQLMRCLRDLDWDVRWAAARAMGQMGEAAASHPEVMPQLLQSLCDASPYVRWAAEEALRRLGKATVWRGDTVAEWIRCLSHSKASVRAAALASLGGAVDQVAREPEVFSRLLASLEDDSPFVCEATCLALADLRDASTSHPEVLRHLWQACEHYGHNDPWGIKRSAAAKAIARIMDRGLRFFGVYIGRRLFRVCAKAQKTGSMHRKAWNMATVSELSRLG